MVKTRIGDEIISTPLRVKIRLDYKGIHKPGKFFFGGKSTEEVAEGMRDQQVGMLRNVPLQGITIEEVDMSSDVYTVFDEMINAQVAFAPVILTVSADSMEDIVRFIAREEFRKIEIMEPENLVMNKIDMERILFKVSEELRGYRLLLERKYSAR
ncbi:MAG: hypothetical protein CVU89_10080 [Firmicutes bacterium HGW-Firmicutes-14]|nr:MAG: hypothetical protein CVU89_10080 [Firmicutes bacterium HGW-Firmicutes-14]